MRILFTPDIFNMQQFGGISRYFVRVAEELCALQNEADIIAPFHINDYLRNSSFGKTTQYRQTSTWLSRKATRAANSLALQFHLASRRPHIVHSTYFRGSPPLLTAANRVVTVFDFVDEIYHQTSAYGAFLAERKRRAVDESDLVICISENTRNDLVRLLGIPVDKTVVTHLSADAPPQDVFQSVHPLGDHPYLLYVGTRWAYKNFQSFVLAFAQSPMCRKDFKIVAFGSPAFESAERELFRKLGLSETQLIQVSGTDRDLYRYYKHASLFVYPSLYEGFGIPPLEAMSVGCPVACSNTSSIPEVVGEAAFCFDPNSNDSIRQQIELALSDRNLRRQKIELGYQQFSKFSWRQCAIDTLNAYKRLSGAS